MQRNMAMAQPFSGSGIRHLEKAAKKAAKKDKKFKKSACNLQRHMINYSSLTAVGMKVQSHIKAVISCESVAQLDRATAF